MGGADDAREVIRINQYFRRLATLDHGKTIRDRRFYDVRFLANAEGTRRCGEKAQTEKRFERTGHAAKNSEKIDCEEGRKFASSPVVSYTGA
jgi:hypothetical protein